MGEVIAFPAPRQVEPSRPTVAPEPSRQAPPSGPEPLWRTVIGGQLRAERAGRGERIADVAERAGMSPQYLSELERGRKDPSSEMLAAVAGALGLTIGELSRRVAHRYYVTSVSLPARSHPASPTARPTGPLCLAA